MLISHHYGIGEQVKCLDLSERKLWGWQKDNSPDRVQFYLDQLQADAEISPVPVVISPFGSYYLTPKVLRPDASKADGGHHRSIAHRLSGVPLPIDIVGAVIRPRYGWGHRFAISELAERIVSLTLPDEV